MSGETRRRIEAVSESVPFEICSSGTRKAIDTTLTEHERLRMEVNRRIAYAKKLKSDLERRAGG